MNAMSATFDILSAVIIWCDITFETENSYQTMRNEFQETVRTRPENKEDSINELILTEAKEEFYSHHIPLLIVRTVDDAENQINEHKTKKIFLISSGTCGRCLVPKVADQYSFVHNIYIYAHNLLLHVDWVCNYLGLVKTFDFPVSLLVRLTRDISKHFIDRGSTLLKINAAKHALTCLQHAEQLEHAANRREQMRNNATDNTTFGVQPVFRDHLDLLQGGNGLINRAVVALREQEEPIETS